MRVRVANEEDTRLWQDFVESHPDACNYHRWKWKQVIERSFGWPTYYLLAEEDGRIAGILPLVLQKSWMFGRFLTSLPYFNYGGIIAEGHDTELALVAAATDLAKKVRADHMELRHCKQLQLGLPRKTNKVAMVFPVEPDEQAMWRALPDKVRTSVRKGIKSGLTAEFPGESGLDDFYEVFAINMRALGTPVYQRQFFLEILRAFPEDAHIGVVRYQGKAIAASFLLGYRETLESVWSSSLPGTLSVKPNMFLGWSAFCFAGKHGYRTFDFGRSSVGSGPYRFKQQWGCREVQLYWDYWLSDGNHLPELNPDNPKYRIAIRVWQQMPLALTKIIGPRIVRCLP